MHGHLPVLVNYRGGRYLQFYDDRYDPEEIDPYTGLPFWVDEDPEHWHVYPMIAPFAECDGTRPSKCQMCCRPVDFLLHVEQRATLIEFGMLFHRPPEVPYDGPRWPWLTG